MASALQAETTLVRIQDRVLLLFHGRQVVCHGTVNALVFGGSNPSRGAIL